jgi:hypothetical protein
VVPPLVLTAVAAGAIVVGCSAALRSRRCPPRSPGSRTRSARVTTYRFFFGTHPLAFEQLAIRVAVSAVAAVVLVGHRPADRSTVKGVA